MDPMGQEVSFPSFCIFINDLSCLIERPQDSFTVVLLHYPELEELSPLKIGIGTCVVFLCF